MKKIIFAISLLLILSSSLTAEVYPPENWNPSFVSSVEQALREDKFILINFTGSDWCIWCKRLWDQVFSTDEFNSWVEENAVLVYLDFPSERTLPQSQVTQNSYLQQFLGVQGYPSIWLLDSDLTPLLVTGYREGGAENYINHLENDRIEIDSTQSEQFRKQVQDFISEYLEPLKLH